MLSDLDRRFNAAPVAVVASTTRSWSEVVQSFIARPAFGMAAQAIVILGISVPRMIDSASTTLNGCFRGSVSSTTESHNIRIVLIQSPAGFQQVLARDIESDMFFSTAASSESITGPRVLVDFANSTITALNGSDEKIHSAPLPADAEEISAAIATAISRL